MKDVAVRIYDWMSGHRWWCLASFVVVTLLMVLSVTRLSYKEDIRDFLPLDEEERTALNDYDRQAQTSLIVAIIEQRDSTIDDPDLLVESVESGRPNSAVCTLTDGRTTGRPLSPVAIPARSRGLSAHGQSVTAARVCRLKTAGRQGETVDADG